MGRGADKPDNMGDQLADWLLAGGETLRLEPGHGLTDRFRRSACLLTDGWLQRLRPLSGGRSATLALYLPGDLVMLDALSGGADRDHLSAIGACELVCRPLAEFEAVLDSDAGIARAAIRRLAQDTRWLREGLTALGRMDARHRLLTFLHQTRSRLSEAGRVEADATRFPMPMNQQQLADAIGVTSIHVNRVLGGLRRDGVLTISQGVVAVTDPQRFDRQEEELAP